MHSLNWTSTMIGLVTNPVVTGNSSSSDWWRQIQRTKAKHLAKIRESWWGEGGGTVRTREVRDIRGKLTEMASLAYEISQNQQPGNLHETDIDPLHISDNWVAQSISRTPSNVSRGCPWCFGWLLGTYSLCWIALPVWIQGEVLGFRTTWYVMLCWCPWEACTFLSEYWRGVGEGREKELEEKWEDTVGI